MARRLQRGFWTLQSRTWDKPYSQAPTASWVTEALDWYAKYLPTGTVLDAGCGTGGHAVPLAERGYAVIGADFSSGMLRRAAAKDSAVTGWVRADLHAPWPVADVSVDGVLSVFALQFLSPLRFCAEIARVVRPGGVAMILWPRADVARRRAGRGASVGFRVGLAAKQLSAVVGGRTGVAHAHKPSDVETAARVGGLDVVESRVIDRSYAVMLQRR